MFNSNFKIQNKALFSVVFNHNWRNFQFLTGDWNLVLFFSRIDGKVTCPPVNKTIYLKVN